MTRKEYYQQNREADLIRSRAWKMANRDRFLSKLRDMKKVYREDWYQWLLAHGWDVPSRQMVYHHPDPTEKDFGIGDFIRAYPVNPANIKRLEDELKKCIYISERTHKQIHCTLNGRC